MRQLLAGAEAMLESGQFAVLVDGGFVRGVGHIQQEAVNLLTERMQ